MTCMLGIFMLVGLVTSTRAAYTKYTAIDGGTVQLECQLEPQGDYLTIWNSPQGDPLASDDGMITSDDRFSVSRRGDTWRLKIRRIRPEDAGNYTCLVYQRSPEELKETHTLELVLDYPPSIRFHSRDQSLQVGADVTLTCEGQGTPNPTISWTFTPFSTQQEKDLSGGMSVVLTDMRMADAGLYTCTASNNIPPTASHPIRLDVEFAPEASMPYQVIGQSVGMATSLECRVTTNPDGEISWIHPDGTVLQSEDRFRLRSAKVGEYETKSELLISGLLETDLGFYQCSATNMYGTNSTEVELVHMDSPGKGTVQAPPGDTLARLGEDATFTCQVTDITSRDIFIWWREVGGRTEKIFEALDGFGPGLAERAGTEKYEIQGSYTLKVKDVTLDDGGVYRCELVGTSNHSATLVVVDSLQCSNGSSTPLTEGDKAQLRCSLPTTGSSMFWDMTWFDSDDPRGSIKLDHDGQIARLLMFKPWASETGSYKCEVKNEAFDFSEDCQVWLNVREPTTPAPPTPSPPPHNNASASGSEPSTGQAISGMYMAVIGLSMLCLLLFVTLVMLIYYFRRQIMRLRRENSPNTVHYSRNGSTMAAGSVKERTSPQRSAHAPPKYTPVPTSPTEVPEEGPPNMADSSMEAPSTPREDRGEKTPLTSSRATLSKTRSKGSLNTDLEGGAGDTVNMKL